MAPLDAGWAGVLGALIGVLGTLATTCLTHKFQNARASSLSEKRRARLRRLLSDKKYVWRNIDTLAAAIGADESATMELLIEIEARVDLKDKKKWALETRAPAEDKALSESKE